jgi:hypothetical protein
MASGILGQANPAAITNTTVYTVPASTTATFTVSMCNRSASTIAVRLAIASTATPVDSEWIEYDALIPPNSVLERTGIVAQAAERVVTYVSAAAVSVNVYGFEA